MVRIRFPPAVSLRTLVPEQGYPHGAHTRCRCQSQPQASHPFHRGAVTKAGKVLRGGCGRKFFLRKPSIRWASCGPAIPSNQLQKLGERIIVVPTVGWLAAARPLAAPSKPRS